MQSLMIYRYGRIALVAFLLGIPLLAMHAQHALGAEKTAAKPSAKPSANSGGKKADVKTEKTDPARATVSVAKLEELVKTLENDKDRKEFVKTLKGLIAAQKAAEKPKSKQPGLIDRLGDRARNSGAVLSQFAGSLADLPSLWGWLRGHIDRGMASGNLWQGLWKTLAALFGGLLVAWLLRLLLARPRRSVEDRSTESFGARLMFLAMRTVLDVAPIAAMAGAAYLILLLTKPSESTADIAITVIGAVVVAWTVAALARMVLVPKAGSLRLISLSDETAAYLFLWVKRISGFTIYSYALLQIALVFNLPAAAYQVLLTLIGLVVAIMLVVFVLQNRKSVGKWFAGEDEKETTGGRKLLRGWSGLSGGLMRRFGDVWHIFAILYIVACFIVWALRVEGGFSFLFQATVWTLVIFALSRILIAGLRRLLARIFRIDPELMSANPNLEARANRYLPIVAAVTFGIVNVVALFAVLQVWGVDILALLATPQGQAMMGSMVTILLLLLGAVLLWEVINKGIDRYVEKLEQQRHNGERAARMRTLMPMLEKGVLGALVVIVGLLVLSELGVNIGPLLAGAGVLGLAIGFGAQTLVKDVITGVFNIIEDTMAVGDVVTAGGLSGTVEDLTIRSVVLRDYSGTQHTIPFSSITDVQNQTKDFSFSVVDIGIGYRENVDDVIPVIQQVGADLRADETFGKNTMSDMEIAGVQELGDSAVVIRVRIKCRPGTQWGIKREINRRIKSVFDEQGIEIPYPHTTIYFGEDKDGNAPPARLQLQRDQGGEKARDAAPKPDQSPEPKKSMAERKASLDPAVDGGD